MSRRQSRELALQALFSIDCTGGSAQDVLRKVADMQDEEVPEKVLEYAVVLVEGTLADLKKIDGTISELARDWKIERMGGVDRNITRMAIFEMRSGADDVPPKAAVNEAVELAKLYGTEESSRFINGILGTIIRAENKSEAP